jgi:dedicated sortase system histidine kinase
MSLRLQLLALVALTLLLPWAGLRLVRAMEDSLRAGLENQLQVPAGVIAQQLAGTDPFDVRSAARDAFAAPLYLHPLSRPPRLDGELDWQFLRDVETGTAASRVREIGGGNRLWLGGHANFVYVYLSVVDDDIVYQATPGTAPHGDRVVLVFGADADRPEAILLGNFGPEQRGDRYFSIRGQRLGGTERFVPTGEFDDAVAGAWRATSTGYAIEARLPINPLRSALGVGVIDSDDGGATAELVATTWEGPVRPNALIGERPNLVSVLRPHTGSSNRFRVFDANGWVLADSGALEAAPGAAADENPSLPERFFRRILRRSDPPYAGTLLSEAGRIGDPALLAAIDGARVATWYARGPAESAIVAAAVPVNPDNPERGAVLIEQASDPILTLTNREMLRLVTTTVVVTLVGSLALLGHASLLSFRIGRLARAAGSALGPRGEIRTTLPGSKARDEIGEMSRSFEELLGRLRDYTDYLQSLKSKLSHELRTPLAIVATSADNLEHETGSEAGRAYLARLRQGAERLESVLQAMTAATRVEQAINQTEFERFDLAAVIASCMAAYDDVYTNRRFSVSLPSEPVAVDGSAELVAQMLDKLIDNAVSFAAEGTAIEVSLTARATTARLDVINRGPLLPEAMRHQLFDSLVSIRRDGGEKPHLGLGLYIVTLVAAFHRGSAAAANLDDGSGVRMSVSLPRSDTGAA